MLCLDIQNELLEAYKSEWLQLIKRGVYAAQYYSIFAGAVNHVSKKNYLASLRAVFLIELNDSKPSDLLSLRIWTLLASPYNCKICYHFLTCHQKIVLVRF